MAAAEKSIEMADLGSGASKSSAPASGASKLAPAGLSQADQAALQPLEDEITLLGASRHTLDRLRNQHSTKYGGRLADSHFRRGTARHHKKLAKDLRTSNRFTHLIRGNVPLKELALAHETMAQRIADTKAAHHALSQTHPHLAWKDGSTGQKNRKYKTPSGMPQRLGNYHGKSVTEDGTPKTFGRGGRKTRKGGRKSRKGGRKTRKHRHKHRRKHRRHHKTKRRKHHRRKHKRKTRRH